MKMYQKNTILLHGGIVREKSAIVIPIKTNNQRLPGKNTKLLAGKPLYQYLFDTVKKCETIDEIFVDSSDEKILKISKQEGFKTIKRPINLNSPETSGHDLVEFELNYINYPIIVQLFVTLPFVKAKTIDNAVQKLCEKPKADSILAVYEIHDRFWYDGKPISHNPAKLVGTQYMKPLCCECGFYIFRRDAFLREKCRVTKRFEQLIVDSTECVDIDTYLDFLYAETIVKHKND